MLHSIGVPIVIAVMTFLSSKSSLDLANDIMSHHVVPTTTLVSFLLESSMDSAMSVSGQLHCLIDVAMIKRQE